MKIKIKRDQLGKIRDYIEMEDSFQNNNLNINKNGENKNKKSAHLHSFVDSSYSSSTLKEQKRLLLQYEYSKACDEAAFFKGIKKLGKIDNMYGLDIGCANGLVTQKRFKTDYGFKKVIGIDYNEESIQEAQVNKNNVFKYYHFNVEDNNFIEDIQDLMLQQNIKTFHTIYLGYTIHHLINPLKFLRKIRTLLSPGGFIILTGVDDGAQLSFGDEGLIDEIVDLTIKTKRISDRFHGRKFYSYLLNAGFKDISMNYSCQDTVGISSKEKELLYQYYFSFRYDYVKKQLESDPNNKLYIKQFNEMNKNLKKLQTLFQKPDFYYLLTTLSAIGFK